MEFLYSLALFVLVLIIYSQLMYQLKKGDDMEIYEIDYTNNKELNDSANLKQPLLFVFSEFDTFFKNFAISQLASEYGSFDVNLKESSDYYSNDVSAKSTVPLNLGAVKTLMNSDSDSKYFSNNNSKIDSISTILLPLEICNGAKFFKISTNLLHGLACNPSGIFTLNTYSIV